MNISNTCDSIPVFPILPISSLSAIMHTAVLFGTSFISTKAVNSAYTQILSSCPYPATILSSKPILLHFIAGTSSNSELKKSSSVIPYFLFNMSKTFNLTASGTSAEYGILPINKFKSSPSIPFFNFFSIWSCAKCGNKSVIVNIGSSSFSPIFISIFSPLFFTITP